MFEHIEAMETHTRQLERELAEAKETIEMLEIRHGAAMLCHQAQMNEVTKQRDALADALRSYVSHHRLRGFVTKSETLKAEQALAAVKGGSHE